MGFNLAIEENNFIQEGYLKNPWVFWICSICTAFSMVFVHGVTLFKDEVISNELQKCPFLCVANRDFSLFLWQYPHLMRVHAKNKIGYLTGFHYLHKVNMELDRTEEYVVAPPEVLFLYHTWNRLLRSYLPLRAIPLEEFKEFLTLVPEWEPKNWPKAPKEYRELVENLNRIEILSLENLPSLPKDIRQAFYGWKNYFKEGEAINVFCPSEEELKSFLTKYPHYARNYWQNIISHEYPNYLKGEMAPFLKVALYNETHP